jgi:o-succinylbenzoate synthase
MNITKIELRRLQVPLITPFKTALRTVDSVHDIIVLIHTDSGHIGYGGAAATVVITGDSHGAIVTAIESIIAPQLVGQSIYSFNHLLQRVHACMVHNTSAKAAVEIALYDLWAQAHQQPLYRMLGGGAHTGTLETDVTISVDSIDKMLTDTEQALARGYRTLKIKIGTNLQDDIERVKAIADQVAERASLRLDVNQGWTAKQTVHALQQLERSGVQLELVEQPVPAHDIAGMKFITERVLTPVMADESAYGPREVLAILQQGAADIINIKLMKTGGLSKALWIADLCELYGVECMIGCMLESSVSVAAAAHLAAAKSSIIRKIDLDSPSLARSQPVQGGCLFEAASIQLNQTPGLGISAIPSLQPL